MLLASVSLAAATASQSALAASSSQPPSDSSQPETVSWQSEPNTRGTWSLLTSCVLTLVVCVYTAVHLNVPHRDDTKRQQLLRRAKWVGLGTLAPELVVYNAWRQWDTAKELTQEIARMRSQTENALPSWTNGWTMVHSFFCVMGGFVMDLKVPVQDHGDPAAGCRPSPPPWRLTLTPKGALRAAALDLELQPLSQEAIKDRSKADSIAKLLASVQAGYMALQLIGRAIDGLPVTELEVNTLGHVMCALIMFFFWMRKPLDVRDPVVIRGDWVAEVGTYWSMSLNQCSAGGGGGGGGGAFEDSEAGILNHLMDIVSGRSTTSDSNEKSTIGEILQSSSGENTDKEISIPASVESKTREKRRQVRILDRWPLPSDQWEPDEVVLIVGGVHGSQSVDELKDTILGYDPWSEIVTRIYCSDAHPSEYRPRRDESDRAGNARFELRLGIEDLGRWHQAWQGRLRDADDPDHNLIVRAKNWTRESIHLNSRRAWLVTPAIALATALYGGLHLLLWNSHFPTSIERWLWRGCALIIAASGLAAVPFVLADNWGIDMDERTAGLAKRWLAPVVSETSLARGGDVGYYLVIGTVLLVYGAARAFLVLEAFISLRSLPPAAYQTPDWSQWIPHL